MESETKTETTETIILKMDKAESQELFNSLDVIVKNKIATPNYVHAGMKTLHSHLVLQGFAFVDGR